MDNDYNTLIFGALAWALTEVYGRLKSDLSAFRKRFHEITENFNERTLAIQDLEYRVRNLEEKISERE